MTRETTNTRPYHPRSYSPELQFQTAPVSKKAFTKMTVSKQPVVSDPKQGSLDLEDSASPLDTPAPRARAPRPTVYDTSDIEYRVGRARSPKARSPKSRSPAKEKSGNETCNLHGKLFYYHFPKYIVHVIFHG